MHPVVSVVVSVLGGMISFFLAYTGNITSLLALISILAILVAYTKD